MQTLILAKTWTDRLLALGFHTGKKTGVKSKTRLAIRVACHSVTK